uniref:Uncharacterized protein n=1 Tax=Arundo donax TaxID=35708 RepID=A0A0A9CAI9_ARUDO
MTSNSKYTLSRSSVLHYGKKWAKPSNLHQLCPNQPTQEDT